MEKTYDPTLLPTRREDAAYTQEELDLIRAIPAQDQRTWAHYATACIEDPDDYFRKGAEQHEVAKRCLVKCPVTKACGEFAVRKAGLKVNSVHGGLTSQQINNMRKKFPLLIWDD